MIKVTKEMRLICCTIASASETSVHILDKVILIRCHFSIGGIIEAHLSEAKVVPFDTTITPQICW